MCKWLADLESHLPNTNSCIIVLQTGAIPYQELMGYKQLLLDTRMWQHKDTVTEQVVQAQVYSSFFFLRHSEAQHADAAAC